MSVRDKLLQKQIQGKNNTRSATDIHETPKPYRRWMPGIRSFLRLRYLGAKQSVLIENKQALRYDVSAEEIQSQIKGKLGTGAGIWPILFRPAFMLPLLMLLLAGCAYLVWHNYQASIERAVFRSDIPAYSDAVYQLKASHASSGNQTNPEILKKIDENIELQTAEVEALKNNILDHFNEIAEVPEKLTTLLDAIQEKEIPPQDLYKLVKQVNDELFINRIPYYLSPMVETADCAHLPLSSFLTRLFGGGVQGSGETCVIYALLSFHVDEFRYYNEDTEDHLAFFTRRLDGLPLNENVLGKVHLGDDSAQILLSNIDATSANSTVAVDDGQLQTKLMPQGMPDVYGLESIARRLQSNVVDQYADELRNSWKWKTEKVWNQLKRSENHVLWELSAFFTHLAYGEELKGILLNEFAGITLNPLLQDQPHYYSIRILFPILQDMHNGTLGDTPPDPALTLSDVARSYKYLAQQVDTIDQVSRDAYEQLFGTALPEIELTDSQQRKVREPLN